jgi:hypothetical protein
MKSVLLLVILSGCSALGLERPTSMYDGPPESENRPELYKKGWQHGCETGAAASANNVYTTRRIFRQDWDLAQDDTYHRGWRDAFTYCRKRVLTQSQK